MTIQGSKKRILIVEDELTYRLFLYQLLTNAGYVCSSCIDGEYAIERLKTEQYDLLVLDYILPGRNAIEIVRWLREQKSMVPAIIITAYPSEALQEQCQTEKNVYLVVKANTTPNALIDLVKEIIK
ncbi:MAG: response regulator [Bacteroidetes bacterium]|nr:response regulator [Bacteroidota bacterium]